MSLYVIGLLLRTPIPGADPAHKLILSVLEEHVGKGEHPDIDALAAIAQMHRATLYRKLSDLAAADLLHRTEQWEGREKSYRWEVNETLLRALHGDRGEGAKERAVEAVTAGFKRSSQSENSRSAKTSRSATRQSPQGESQSATERHNSQSENSRSATDVAPVDVSQSANPPLKNPPLGLVKEVKEERARDANETWRRCYEAAGPGLADPSKVGTLLTTQTTILHWIANGADLELDVLPTIASCTARPRQSPIRSWTYFTESVAKAKRDREAGFPQPENSHAGRSETRTTRADIDAAIERAASESGW